MKKYSWKQVMDAGKEFRQETIRQNLRQMTKEERIEIEKELGIK